jgi:hypothetical protein
MVAVASGGDYERNGFLHGRAQSRKVNSILHGAVRFEASITMIIKGLATHDNKVKDARLPLRVVALAGEIRPSPRGPNDRRTAPVPADQHRRDCA